MVRDLHCTRFQATVALCVYPLGFALVPLFSTAFSEEVGRRPIYLVTALASVLCYVFAAMFVLILRPITSTDCAPGPILFIGLSSRVPSAVRLLRPVPLW